MRNHLSSWEVFCTSFDVRRLYQKIENIPSDQVIGGFGNVLLVWWNE
jgi:hypothetical protein